MVGGPGNDGVLGGDGSDDALGGSGNDFVQGGHGSDRVVGEEGGDLLFDGPFRETSKDFLSGGEGDDIIVVNNRPATEDIVACGSGFDRVLVDREDVTLEDCERVFTRFQPFIESIPPAVVEFFDTFFEQLAPSPLEGAPVAG